MHAEILSGNQQALFGLIDQFRRPFYLAGGTATAMYIGHRRAPDFDFYSYDRLDRAKIRVRLMQSPYELHVLLNDAELFRCEIHDVNINFINYPYPVKNLKNWSNIVSMPSLLSLAAMKAFDLEPKSKWEDYVDLYFILTKCYSIAEITAAANKIYPYQFFEKRFRELLAFHKDIDYSREVEYMMPNPPTPDEIRNTLIEKATAIF
jgi:hypothetical protein